MTLNTNEVQKEIKLCEKYLQAGLIDSSGKAIQNIFIITGKAIQNIFIITGKAIQNIFIITGKAIQNIFIITGKAILTKDRNKQPLLSNNIRQGIRKGKPHKKWFDEECRFQKEKTNKLANKENNNSQNNQIKQERDQH